MTYVYLNRGLLGPGFSNLVVEFSPYAVGVDGVSFRSAPGANSRGWSGRFFGDVVLNREQVDKLVGHLLDWLDESDEAEDGPFDDDDDEPCDDPLCGCQG